MAKGRKTGGRTAGTPNKVNRELREMIESTLSELGGITYLKTQAEAEPAAFLSLLGKCLPKDVKITPGMDGEITIRFSNGKVQS